MFHEDQPRDWADRARTAPSLPPGDGERFGGYGVMGVPFSTGHYLALRHFTASSLGTAYRAVWHRDPEGGWRVYADAPDEVSCARYLGSALTGTRTCEIGIDWSGPRTLTVSIDGILSWHLEIGADTATRLMNAMGAVLPASACHAHRLLRPMGTAVGPMLSVGAVRLTGRMPEGQRFGTIPRKVWRITASSATMRGEDLGIPAPLPTQDRLGDFLLPQSGLFFAAGAAAFT